MPRNLDNRRQAFADVVTIDAWHDVFDGTHAKADLHADVVFGTARVGGESTSPVRFRLSVRCAEIVVVIPELEPVSVDRASVSRDAPTTQAQLTEIRQHKGEGSIKATASSSISPLALSAQAAAEVTGKADASVQKTIEVTETVTLMIVTQSQTADGHYRWLLRPGLGDVLQGRPWRAESQPRLKLVDGRSDPTKGIPPTVRVEVRCRREDLVIEGLEIKDETTWARMKERLGFRNRMAAAVSYIRDQLTREGLDANNLEDIFGELTLGSTTAGPN